MTIYRTSRKGGWVGSGGARVAPSKATLRGGCPEPWRFQIQSVRGLFTWWAKQGLGHSEGETWWGLRSRKCRAQGSEQGRFGIVVLCHLPVVMSERVRSPKLGKKRRAKTAGGNTKQHRAVDEEVEEVGAAAAAAAAPRTSLGVPSCLACNRKPSAACEWAELDSSGHPVGAKAVPIVAWKHHGFLPYPWGS